MPPVTPITAPATMATRPENHPDTRPAQLMFTALHTTHQHADTKAGILAAAQAALVGTAGAWSAPALRTAADGGAKGLIAGALLIVFLGAMAAGAGCLAAVLRPRLLRPTNANRYSFVHLTSGPDILPARDDEESPGRERLELSQTIRFLSQVAVRKYRWVTATVVCTSVMGGCAGTLMVLRPILT
ncbi:Pycsar system effector family protein [Streptomyces sp. NPDC006798]|uniref:Pycsar system effector family protein n=1 Tax=Streptomyces sp. NPDC006798 TaxID=3155462 RepID=UPI0033C1C740